MVEHYFKVEMNGKFSDFGKKISKIDVLLTIVYRKRTLAALLRSK